MTSFLQLGRLRVGAPLQWYEQVGDPVTNLGGSVVPASRTALRHAVSQGTFAADGQADTLASRLVLRRQLRSLLNNTPLKLQGFIYVQYSDDPDQNGWYVLDQGQFADIEGSSGLATGAWKMDNVNWMLVGHQRLNREARNIWMKDLRSGLYPRDMLKLILSSDFSALPALAVSIFPHGAKYLANTVTMQRVVTQTLSTGRDGGACVQAVGLSDLACISYERDESTMYLSDVIVYDRAGAGDAPSAGPGASWNEVYGPDWPWNWLNSGQPQDAPVLDNGLMRIRYDATVGIPGLRVDVWSGSAYVEKGKFTFKRYGSVIGYCDTFVSANLHTDTGYTPDRAIVAITLAASVDPESRERIFITLQRGLVSCTVEYYPAPNVNNTAYVTVMWTPTAGDANDSVMKVDSQVQPPPAGAASVAATAGSGSSLLPYGPILGADFVFISSENYVSYLRCSSPSTLTAHQHTISVLQVGVNIYVGSDTSAYGVVANAVFLWGGRGYTSIDMSFAPASADQVMEAEAMTLGASTASTADGSASGGSAATSTRTSDANAHVTRTNWPNYFIGQYRVFVRIKVSANAGSVYLKTSLTTTVTVTFTNTTYAWVDLGEVRSSGTLETHAWMSAGAGTVSVDRIEAFLTQDRTRPGATYSGARDAGQAVLYDARQLGAIVAR